MFREQTRPHEQRSQVFLEDPALPVQERQESPQMRTIDPARRASYSQLCQEVIEIFDLQLSKSNAVFFKVSMERGKNPFDLFEVFESSVGLLVEIGLEGIGQLDLSPRVGQRPRNPAVDRKKTRQFDESTGSVLETAKLRELFQGVWGKDLSQTISLLVVKRRKSIKAKESRMRGR